MACPVSGIMSGAGAAEHSASQLWMLPVRDTPVKVTGLCEGPRWGVEALLSLVFMLPGLMVPFTPNLG